LRRGVETLLAKYGASGTPAVHRVAIEQRRNDGGFDGTFESDTDPSNIDLQTNTNANQLAWITIAPDWEWMPRGTTYSLSLADKPAVVLATTPWTRLLPATIFAKAGMPLAATDSRTVKLLYRAFSGRKVIARMPVSLTFTATGSTTISALAPDAPLLATGKTIPVRYDISNVANVSNPQLIVTFPGRFDPSNFSPFNYLSIPLTNLAGKVDVPVSSLHGGGIYGIGVIVNATTGAATDFNYIRVAPPQSSALRPLPPTLSGEGQHDVHYLAVPYNTAFDVRWDVHDVPGATGAIVEISAPGPAGNGIYNTFNNPEGSIVDKDGVDSGSVYSQAVSGVNGTLRVNPVKAGLSATFEHVVRVIPTKDGTAVGQASDVSMVSEAGLATADGGSVGQGFGLNSNGTDGFLTSWQFNSSLAVSASLETFSTATTSITGTIASQFSPCCTGPSLFYRTIGGGIVGSDIGLYELFDQMSNTTTYGLLNPVATGTLGASWSPPVSNSFQFLGAAYNQSTTNVAFYGNTPNSGSGSGSSSPTGTWSLFASNLATNTFSPVYDITSAISAETTPEYQMMAQNPTTNQAWLASTDLTSSCSSPRLVDVDLSTGATSSFVGVGAGTAQGMSIDPATNVAAVTTDCDAGMGIYNLTTQTSVHILLPGAGQHGSGEPGYYLTADPVHHLILLAQLYGVDAFTNCNALGHLLIYDESGNLVEDKEDFDWVDQQINMSFDGIQISPSARTGLTFSPAQDELEPFTY
jgi:hypothetical protein